MLRECYINLRHRIPEFLTGTNDGKKLRYHETHANVLWEEKFVARFF